MKRKLQTLTLVFAFGFSFGFVRADMIGVRPIDGGSGVTVVTEDDQSLIDMLIEWMIGEENTSAE